MKSRIFNQLALILFSSFFICSTLSYAADINITTSQTTTQTFTENNQKMTIGAGGDISTTSSAGISETSNTGAVIVVNSGDVSKGVAASGASAIAFSGTAALSTATRLPVGITLTTGRVTSDVAGNSGTVLVNGAGTSFRIRLAATRLYQIAPLIACKPMRLTSLQLRGQMR